MYETHKRDMTIGDVARRARVNIDTLRYYEKRGLVAKPPRTAANYRLYDQGAVHLCAAMCAFGFCMNKTDKESCPSRHATAGNAAPPQIPRSPGLLSMAANANHSRPW